MVSQNIVETRFTATIKIHYNLTLRPSQYSDKMVAVSKISLRSARLTLKTCRYRCM